MDIKPNLFATQPPARTPRQASEARLAFEAMLSAGAARHTIARSEARPDASPSPVQSTPSIPSDDALTPLARPGRVLDIRV
jgi:hypothetical protein